MHFEENQVLTNRFCRRLIFFVFGFLHFLCKIKIFREGCQMPISAKWLILEQDAFVFEITVSFIVFVSDKFSVNHLTLQKDNENIYPFNPNPGGRQIAWKRWGVGWFSLPYKSESRDTNVIKITNMDSKIYFRNFKIFFKLLFLLLFFLLFILSFRQDLT